MKAPRDPPTGCPGVRFRPGPGVVYDLGVQLIVNNNAAQQFSLFGAYWVLAFLALGQ